MRMSLGIVVLASALALSSSAGAVLVQRTFVASTGVDTQPCSLQQPCRSFAAAMANTQADGEVIVLDSAGYGPVAIAQHVAIIAPPGIYAGISVPGPAPGISINSARVVLEGLTINGIGGTVGISVTNSGELHMSNCSIANFATAIDANDAQVFVHDTELRDISGVGVSVAAGSRAILSKVRTVKNGIGVRTDDGTVSLIDSALAGGTTGLRVGVNAGTTDFAAVHGTLIADMAADAISVTAGGAGSTSNVDVLGSTIARNAANGIAVTTQAGGKATVVVADSQLTNNGYAIQTDLGTGTSTTLSNRNLIAGNGLGGLKAINGGTLNTRGNNSGEQVAPTSGTTLVGGF